MLNWKEQRKNAYPNIILSDCIIDEIQVSNQDIVIKFLRHGFVIKDDASSKYYRTKSAQIVIKECDIDNILIQYVYNKKKLGGKVIQVIKDMKLHTFFNNISEQKWRYEIVEEYYSEVGCLFIGKIRVAKNSMWCYIKIFYKDIIYFWNEVDYDCWVQ